MADAPEPSETIPPSAEPGAAQDLWAEDHDAAEAPPTPLRRRAPLLAAVGVAMIGVLLGYAVGFSRGRSGNTSQASPETTAVTTTQPAVATPTTAPPPAARAPVVALKTIAFDAGLPKTFENHPIVAPRGDWGANQAGVGPGRDGTSTTVSDQPRRYGKGPDLLVDTGAPVTVAQVRLVDPTVYSGLIGRFVDDRNYWVVAADQGLRNISLLEIKDGTETSKGFVNQPVTPGITIGLASIGGTAITITVNGQPQVLSTFYGSRESVPDDGINGTSVGLLAGESRPVFADLEFG
jgi:hypothetical protein